MAEGGGESIKVVVRVRGLIAREGGEAKAFTTEDSTDLVQQSNKKRWTFDRVYSPKEDTRLPISNPRTPPCLPARNPGSIWLDCSPGPMSNHPGLDPSQVHHCG